MEPLLEDVFLKLLNMSITASYVILFVIVARIFLRRAPKVFSYALWVVVFFRLICPFSFSSAFSFIGAIGAESTQYIPTNIGMMPQPQINTGLGVLDTAVNTSLPAATPYASINPMQITIFIASIVWAFGVVCLLVYSVSSYLLLKKKASTAMLVRSNIYECEKITSPFVLGIIRPKIYLPFGMSESEKSFVLKHELTHIKRFDHLIKPAAFLILCAYWFNPLVCLAFTLMSKDMEMSCDERVLKETGSSCMDIKRDYSSLLLSLSVGKKPPNGCPLAFGESNAKSRIKNILRYKRPALWVTLPAVIVVTTAGIILMADPARRTGDNIPDYDSMSEYGVSTAFTSVKFEALDLNVSIPQSWEEKYIIEESENRVTFLYYEGGILFDIMRFTGDLMTEQDFYNYPSGSIILQSNGYTYRSLFPTDVQAPIDRGEAFVEKYNRMSSEISGILASANVITGSPPQSSNRDFKVVGTGYFTVEIPNDTELIPSDDTGHLCWFINTDDRTLGRIEMVSLGSAQQKIEESGTTATFLTDESGFRTAMILTANGLISVSDAAKISESFEFRDGPFSGIDLLSNAAIYLNIDTEAKKLFGKIEGFDMTDGSLSAVIIQLMRLDPDETAGSGFKIIDSELTETYPLDFGGSVNVLPLVSPDYNSYNMFYMPLIAELTDGSGQLLPPYDVMYYDFIVADGNIKIILGHYVP